MNKRPLPVVGTSAAKTAFCAEKIEAPSTPGDYYLWIDGNGKITAGNGTLAEPKPNAFSLIQIADCPFRTSICEKACYVHGLEKHAPDTHALYVHNSKTIRAILNEHPDTAIPQFWAMHVGNWIKENCVGGFRWHVSGDVFSIKYAEWIRSVCYWSVNVEHWIYTRSVAFLEPLKEALNLTVNLSADAENYPVMRRAARDYGFRLTYLTTDGVIPNDMEKGDIIFPDYNLRSATPEGQDWWSALDKHHQRMMCPVDYFGKSEELRCGPCDKCLV